MQKVSLKIQKNTLLNQTAHRCNIVECQSTIRIGNLLKQCFHFENILGDRQYSYVEILNDFHHILSTKCIITALSNKKQSCTGTSCILFRRNHRNRDIDRNTKLLNTLYSSHDDNNILLQRLIDRIHCHYFHATQIGHRLIFNNVSLTDEKHHQQNSIQSTKFLMKANAYSFGNRFFYWNYYKNNKDRYDPTHWGADIECIPRRAANKDATLCDWYINPKYTSFAHEMIDNDIKTISKYQWKLGLKAAKKHTQSIYFKRLFCARSESAEYYDLKSRSAITEHHILSVMLYCNNDFLQNEFTKTFRRIADDESDEDLKQRHSNFYWWARYLRESVECFGMKWYHSANFRDSLTVYHGVVGQMMLPSLFACVKGPMSTTRSRASALNFSEKGMIFEITIKISEWVFKFDEDLEAIQRISCFECHYLSDFTYEQEVLFIGGLNNVTISNIEDTVSGINYMLWIRALELITNDCICEGSWRNDIDISLRSRKRANIIITLAEQLLSRVLLPYYPFDDNLKVLATNKCPLYIFELTKKHLSTVQSATFCKNIIINPVNGALLRYESSEDAWFDLERIIILYPNVTKISFDAIGKECEFINNDHLYQSVWKLLESSKPHKIQSITIDIDHMKVSVFEIDAIIQQYKQKFHSYSWCIGIHRIPQYKYGINTHINDMTDKWEVIIAPLNSVQLWPKYPLNRFSKLEILSSNINYAQMSDIFDQYQEVICFYLCNKINMITADPTVIKQNCFYILFLVVDVSLLACNPYNYYFHLLFWFGVIEFCQIWFVHRWVLQKHTKYPMLGGSDSIATIQGSYFFGGFIFRTTWSVIGCWIATQIVSPLLVFRKFIVSSTVFFVIMALIMDAECWPRYYYWRVFIARSIGFGTAIISFFWHDLYLGYDEVHIAFTKVNKYPELEYLYYALRRLRQRLVGNYIFVYICDEIPHICDILHVWKQVSICGNIWVLIPLQDLEWMSLDSMYRVSNDSLFKYEFIVHQMALSVNTSCSYIRELQYQYEILYHDILISYYEQHNDSIQAYLDRYQPILAVVHGNEVNLDQNIFFPSLSVDKYNYMLMALISICIWFVTYCKIFKCCRRCKRRIKRAKRSLQIQQQKRL